MPAIKTVEVTAVNCIANSPRTQKKTKKIIYFSINFEILTDHKTNFDELKFSSSKLYSNECFIIFITLSLFFHL